MVSIMSSQFLDTNPEMIQFHHHVVVGTWDQGQDVAINQAGHYSLVERLLYAWETQHFGLEDLLETHRDTGEFLRPEQTPMARSKACRHRFWDPTCAAFFKQICLRLTTIRNWTCNWKSGISSMKFIPSVEQLPGCLFLLQVQFLTLALLHKGESAGSLDVAGHEDFTFKNHEQPYYGI